MGGTQIWPFCQCSGMHIFRQFSEGEVLRFRQILIIKKENGLNNGLNNGLEGVCVGVGGMDI